uniref:Uncharacterized protein n=1 Tax=Arundo donax TaxID=35708 RepID=A0A0A9BYT4_ARUDO
MSVRGACMLRHDKVVLELEIRIYQMLLPLLV